MTQHEFGEIVEKYQRLMLTICYQFVKDKQIAEDLTQETFVSAFLHIDSCPKDAIKPWLARIATNKAKDYLKSAYNRRVQAADEPQDFVSNQIEFTTAHAPESIYIAKEGANHVREEIYALKEPYLKVSVMFFIEEKTIDEISALLNRPAKTVHTQLYRARNILKATLSKEVT